MGMLDDAIREHLELKRRRGADPSEVEREQAEALAAMAEHELEDEQSDSAEGNLEPPLAPETGTPVIGSLELEADEEIQETAELDMERVLQDGGEGGPEATTGADVHHHGSQGCGVPDDLERTPREDVGYAQEELQAPGEPMRTDLPEDAAGR